MYICTYICTYDTQGDLSAQELKKLFDCVGFSLSDAALSAVRSVCVSVYVSVYVSVSVSLCVLVSLSPPPSFSLTHTISLSLSLTHTHTLSLSLPLFLFLSASSETREMADTNRDGRIQRGEFANMLRLTDRSLLVSFGLFCHERRSLLLK